MSSKNVRTFPGRRSSGVRGPRHRIRSAELPSNVAGSSAHEVTQNLVEGWKEFQRITDPEKEVSYGFFSIFLKCDINSVRSAVKNVRLFDSYCPPCTSFH